MSSVAIGGGKGGTGRSLLASGLAVFAAQLGRKVLLLDAAPFGSTLGPTFGISLPDGRRPPWAHLRSSGSGVEGDVPGVRLLFASSEVATTDLVDVRRPASIVHSAEADAIVFDLAAGTARASLDAMLGADTMVLVTTPEPTAVEAVHRTVRHLYARALERAFRGHPIERSALRTAVRASGGPPAPIRLADQIQSASALASEIVFRELGRLRPRLVVNCTRTRADLDLGEAICVVAAQQFGIRFEYLGHVEYDDAVILAARHRRPLLVEAPAARASRNLERIARRWIAGDVGRADARSHDAESVFRLREAMGRATHYETLAIDRGATDEEVRKAYRRMRECYAPDSLAASGVLSVSETMAAIARIEEARDVLLDHARRRPYDLSITPVSDLARHAELSSRHPALDPLAEPAPLPELTPDTEYSGALLKAIREARGVDVRAVSARTKISPTYLHALENEEFERLPAAVYTRGFVVEIAKYHRLDVEQVSRTYMRRFRDATGAGGD